MQLDSIQSILVFVFVAESNSFSGAARRLGITPSGASKAVSRLEAKIGVRLIERTTRRLQLTDEGVAFLESCREVVAQLEDAEAVLANRRHHPAGRVLLQMPVAFGRLVVGPLLHELTARHPDFVIDVHLSDRRAELSEEDFDVLLRIGPPPQSRLVARKLYDMRYATVASPAYLERHGEPVHPTDLFAHRCFAYLDPSGRKYRPWHFDEHGRTFSTEVSGQFNVNNAEALLDAAIDGRGIATVARFVADRALREGRVREVLAAYGPPSTPINLMYPEARYRSPRVRLLVDFLLERVGRPS